MLYELFSQLLHFPHMYICKNKWEALYRRDVEGEKEREGSSKRARGRDRKSKREREDRDRWGEGGSMKILVKSVLYSLV